MRRVSVLTINPRLAPLTYAVPEGIELQTGSIVTVPVGSRELAGVVWDVPPDDVPEGKLRLILSASLLPPISRKLIQLIEWTADYYLAEPSAVLRMALASGAGLKELKRARAAKSLPCPAADHATPALSEPQLAAAVRLNEAVRARSFAPILLNGVTGSGKTEVYFEAIAEALRGRRQALILLPEIALTQPFLARFGRRFGCAPVAWHSDLTPAARRAAFQSISRNEAKVVVGARSALFLPYPDLGVIIVDEAHEASFKQDEGVPYHARDVAVMRARFESIPVVLATATPALETRQQVALGHYAEIKLPSRFGGATLPSLEAIDLTRDPPDRGRWIAPTLVRAIEDALHKGEQSLLFLNRRGYAPLTLCRTCGHRFKCPNCSAWMVEHRAIRRLQCHHCGHMLPPPRVCPECQDEDSLVACGPGVERIADEVALLFPDASRAVATSDTLSSPRKVEAFVAAMAAGETDIVIGTQLVTKGYHFPNLTLVGVIDADVGLQGGDLRAGERSFHQISQVAGRAGRAEKPGRVFIQTHEPQASVIMALLSGDSDRFYETELAERCAADAPPFGRYAALIVAAQISGLGQDVAARLGQSAPRARDVHVYGPAPAPLAMLRGWHRFRLLVHAKRSVNLQAYLRAWLSIVSVPRAVRLRVDVDPYNFN